MRRTLPIILILFGIAIDAPGGTITGVITDSQGVPQPSMEVYLYRGESIRRPADYISGKSGPDGRYRVTVPVGEYRAIARERREGDERFGPLPLDRRHSGSPVVITIDRDDATVTHDFTVYSLREAAALKKREQSTLVTRMVRIVDRLGKPVPGAIAYAVSPTSNRLIPDYLSPSSDSEGMTSLSLPPGQYRVGATTHFPPERVFPSTSLSTDSSETVTLPLDPQ